MLGALSLPLRAATISPAVAREAAERWLARSAVFSATGESFQIVEVTPLALGTGKGQTLYHVALAPRGYLVLGGDDRLPPVLAFSAQGDLDLGHAGLNACRALLAREATAWRGALALAPGLSTEARTAVRGAMEQHRAQWRELAAAETQLGAAEEPGGSTPAVSAVVVGPLLQTQWSQWNHYNNRYPADPQPVSGYNGRAPAGCMPVAAAQLGRFYSWPTRGDGGHTDDDANHINLIAGAFEARFLDPFQWAATQNTYDPWNAEPSPAVNAVADILYRFGVALNLDYGSFTYGGSSASLQALGRALNRFLFYERGTYVERATNPASFDSMLRAEILAGRPVICAIPDHAVVVDGLSVEGGVDYYHMNYGLGGLADGWYRPSAIPEGSLSAAHFGQRPAFIPLLQTVGVTTNVDGHLVLPWTVAAARQGEVQRFRVREGTLASTNISDSAGNLQQWTDYSGTWLVESPGRNGGTCIRKVAEIGDYALRLRDVIVPAAATVLQFDYKAILVQDHVYLQLSTDRGATWTTLRHLTNTGWDPVWRTGSVALGSYAGREVMVRILYAFSGGSYYGANGGFWLDNVAINGGQQMRWNVLADHIAPAATHYDVGVRLSGTQHFEVQAYNGSSWSAASPFVTITVALDPALDVDGDGLPNGWEQTHFGSATGGVAQADNDGDGFSNLAECAAGTNPHSAASLLMVSSVEADAAQPVVQWPSVSGKTYTLWRATSLTSPFMLIASNLPATPPVNTYTDALLPSWSAAYYRVGVPD